MFQLFMDKQFIPVIAVAITIFLILIIRPSFLVKSSTNSDCPYCLNPWLVTLVVLVVGGATYAAVNQDAAKPQLNIYSS
uniref:Uncharacterized protein n=1 Tax=Marseillevirus LCMAC202 TaxID=2506606 RepID=A0A481Z039_9VIRU|nr:MAG: hypothetical protein LCMAC202_05060 [Marseillevirus LCMAC202]